MKNQILNHIRELQKEHKHGSDAYNALRKVEVEIEPMLEQVKSVDLADVVGHHVKIMDWKTESTPICYKTGDWDGKASDLCLCQDKEGEYHLAKCYEYPDGQIEWYDKDDFGLRHEVAKWVELE